MLLDTVTDVSAHLRTSMLEANRALLSVTGHTRDSATRPTGPGRELEPGGDHPSWEVQRDWTDGDGIEVGDSIRFGKRVSEADVRRFAAATGDTNPIHLDDDAASETRFGDRIAHGVLVGGLISAALARLPGQVIYLSQDMSFYNPVSVGERVTATCEVAESLGEDRYRLRTTVDYEETTAVDGEAVVLIESAETDD
jgi:acyl dehydratase